MTANAEPKENSRYYISYSVTKLITILGWFVAALGVFIAVGPLFLLPPIPVAFSGTYQEVMRLLPGILVSIGGLALVVLCYIARAIIEQAERYQHYLDAKADKE